MEFSKHEVKDVIDALAYAIIYYEDYIKDTKKYIDKDKTGYLEKSHIEAKNSINRYIALMKKFNHYNNENHDN